MARYDIAQVRDAASGRWPELFASTAGVSIELFDGKHHPCPKCGGTDRFRFTNHKEGGSCICNQCFSSKNGDGFAVLQWLSGQDFKHCLESAAKYLGIKPEKGKRKADPTEHLEFLPWNPTTVGIWCSKKKPIEPAAVKMVGGRVARYRDKYTVIAIPTWGPSLSTEPPVGWTIYRADGGDLPKWSSGSKDPEWVKVKLTYGSQPGIITKIQ